MPTASHDIEHIHSFRARKHRNPRRQCVSELPRRGEVHPATESICCGENAVQAWALAFSLRTEIPAGCDGSVCCFVLLFVYSTCSRPRWRVKMWRAMETGGGQTTEQNLRPKCSPSAPLASIGPRGGSGRSRPKRTLSLSYLVYKACSRDKDRGSKQRTPWPHGASKTSSNASSGGRCTGSSALRPGPVPPATAY